MTLENESRNLFQSNNNAYKEFLVNIDRAHKEGERQLNHDLNIILDDMEEQSLKYKKLAVCQILSIVKKGYFENFDKNNEELQDFLNSCLQEGAEVMAPLFDKMGKDLENRMNYIQGSYLRLITQLVENIHQQAVDLLNLSWEGELETPSIIINHINFTFDFSKHIFSKASTPPESGLLPDSILKPLVLMEIKKLVPIEVEKLYLDWQQYYQDYLQETSIKLKDNMGTMIEAAKNFVRPQGYGVREGVSEGK